jgi:hypothetical protein
LLTDPPRFVVVGGRMNAWVAVLEGLVWPDGSPRIAAPPLPVRAALLAELHPPDGGVIAEWQVPPAAQRLRDDGVGPPMGVIAEPEVPPAAQRLRDQEIASPGSAPRRRLGRGSGPSGVADRPAAPRCGREADECLVAVLEWLVWPDGSPRIAAPPLPVPAALLAEFHPLMVA